MLVTEKLLWQEKCLLFSSWWNPRGIACPRLLIYKTIIEWHSSPKFCNSTTCCFTSSCEEWKLKSCNEPSFRITGYIFFSIRKKKKSVAFINPDSSTVVLLLYIMNDTLSDDLKYIYCLGVWKLPHVVSWDSAAVFARLACLLPALGKLI